MNKKIWAAIGGAALIAATALPALAAEQSVTATVTPEIVSITVTDGSVDYGVLNVSETANTITLSQTQTIENTGNVSAEIKVKSSDAVATTGWDLVAAASVGADTYGHKYQIETSGSYTDFPATNLYTATVDTLDKAGGVDPDATLDLEIFTPTSISDTSVHTVTVVVQATAL